MSKKETSETQIPKTNEILAMSIQELKVKLNELEIPFKKGLCFAELLALLPKEFKVSVADRKKAYQEIIDRYKVQNPVKYETKEKELLAKLKAIK